jgi:hypothetical protein
MILLFYNHIQGRRKLPVRHPVFSSECGNRQRPNKFSLQSTVLLPHNYRSNKPRKTERTTQENATMQSIPNSLNSFNINLWRRLIALFVLLAFIIVLLQQRFRLSIPILNASASFIKLNMLKCMHVKHCPVASPGSSLSIVTRLWAQRQGFDSREGRRIQTGTVAHPGGTLSPGDKSGGASS